MTTSGEIVRRLRFGLFRWLLPVSIVVLALRLPPGQDLLIPIVEAALSGLLEADVDIGRLRTNLWDEVRLWDVEVRTADAAELRLGRLEVRMKSGPPFADGPASIVVEDVALRPAGPQAGDPVVRVADRQGSDLRRWLPDVLHVRGLRILQDGTTAPALALTGWLTLQRQADAAGGVARLQLAGHDLSLHAGAHELTSRVDGSLAVGRRWVELPALSLQVGDAALNARAAYEAGSFSAQAEASGSGALLQAVLPASAGGADWRNAQVKLLASAHGPLADPLVHFDIAVRADTSVYWRLDSARAAGTWAGEQAWIDTFLLAGAAGRLSGRMHLLTSGLLQADMGVEHEGSLHLLDVDMKALPMQAFRALAAPSTGPAPDSGRAGLAGLSGRLSGRVDWHGDTTADLPVDRALIDVELADPRYKGIRLGPTKLHADWNQPAASGVVTTALGRLRVAGTIHNSTTHALQWRLEALDLRALDGWAGLSPFRATGQAQFTSAGALHSPEVEGTLDLRGLRIAGLQLARLQAGGGIDSSGDFTISVTDGSPRSHLLATGNLQNRALHLATLSIGGTDLSDYLPGPGSRMWRGRLTAAVDLQGDLDHPQASGLFRLDNVGLRGQPLGDIHWRISLADGQVDVGVAALDSTVQLLGSIDLNTAGLPIRLAGGIVEAQLQPLLALLTHEPVGYQGSLQARLRLQGLLLEPGNLDVDVGLQSLRVSTPRGELALQHPGLVTLRAGVVRFAPLDFEGSAGRMRVAGSVARDGPLDLHYELEGLGLGFLEPFIQQRSVDLTGRLAGRLDLLGSATDPRISGQINIDELGALGLRLGDLHGAVSYARGVLQLHQLDLVPPSGGKLHGEARGPLRLPVAGLRGADARVDYEATLDLQDVVLDAGQGLSDGVQALVTGSVQLAGGSLLLKDLIGQLELSRLELARGPYLLASDRALSVALQRGHLVVADTASFIIANGSSPGARPVPVSIAGTTADRRDGLHLAASSADLHVLSQLFGVPQEVTGQLDADLRLRGPLSAPELSMDWFIPVATVDSVAVADLRAELHFAAGDLALTHFRAMVAGGELDMRGRISHAEASTPAGVELTLEATDIELAPFRRLAPWMHDRLDHLSGRFSGHLQVEGARTQPVFSGTLAVAAGVVGIAGLKPRLRFARAEVMLSQDSLKLSGLTDEDGRWDVTAAARLHSGGISDFDMSLQLHELRFDMPGTMTLNTVGNLRWQGTMESSQLSGALFINNGHITEDMSLRTLAFSTPDSNNSRADTTGPDARLAGIELAVSLEGRELLVDNQLARIPFTADLVLFGSAARPVLHGELAATSGRVQYMGHEFTVGRARFQFDKDRPMDDVYLLFHDPARLNPTIDFASQTEIKASNGNEYDVLLGLSGSFRTIDFHLTSDPPEGEMDVLSLLRFGRTGVPMLDARGGMLTTQANLNPGYLLSMTESSFSRVLGLDNVQIDNSVLKPGRLAGSRIVLTKQLGKRTEMTYSTTVGYAAQGRVQLQYDLGYNVYVQTQHDAKGESGVDVNLKLKFR